jgi:hypothetical protein
LSPFRTQGRCGSNGLDYRKAAITFAAALPEAGPVTPAIWSFSASGSQVVQVAARDRRLAAALAQTPTADSLAAARNAALYQTPRAVLAPSGDTETPLAGPPS